MSRRRVLSLALAAAALVAGLSSWAGPALAADGAGGAGERLSVLQALVLGVVEGITEYLPVSSTGHLVLFQRLMGLGASADARTALDAYTVIIQFGAILAVLVLSWRRVVSVVRGVFGRDPQGRALAVNLVVAFVPLAVVGLLFNDAIDEHLLEVGPVAAALIVGGIALVILVPRLRARAERGDPLEALTVRSALIIGLLQALALWPGTSRSLVTILGGLAVGLTVAAAVEFSFLLGLLTLGVASFYSAAKDGGTVIDAYGWLTPTIGVVAAAVAGYLAIRSFVNFLSRRELTVFGWYRMAVGVLIVVLMATTSRF